MRHSIQNPDSGLRRTFGDHSCKVGKRHLSRNDRIYFPRHVFRGIGVVFEQRQRRLPDIVPNPGKGLQRRGAVFWNTDGETGVGFLEGSLARLEGIDSVCTEKPVCVRACLRPKVLREGAEMEGCVGDAGGF
jgi:hypothetical protein